MMAAACRWRWLVSVGSTIFCLGDGNDLDAKANGWWWLSGDLPQTVGCTAPHRTAPHYRAHTGVWPRRQDVTARVAAVQAIGSWQRVDGWGILRHGSTRGGITPRWHWQVGLLTSHCEPLQSLASKQHLASLNEVVHKQLGSVGPALNR
jgi:hypothetical protein